MPRRKYVTQEYFEKFQCKFDTFCTNHFKHLKWEVHGIAATLVIALGFEVAIFLALFQHMVN
jgi:hypothetical protein